MMDDKNKYLSLLGVYQKEKAAKYGILRMGIFGSVARGEQTESSDVDVCIELAHPDLFAMVHIKDDLQQLFHRPVDVVRLRDNMNPILLQQIKRDGIYV